MNNQHPSIQSIAWNKVCRPKIERGLVIRKTVSTLPI